MRSLLLLLVWISPFLSVAQDTKNTKRKSVWEQMGDHADSVRQRNKDIAVQSMNKNDNLPYSNPENYNTEAPEGKGEAYVEYTVNGKKISLITGVNIKGTKVTAGRLLNNVSASFTRFSPYALIQFNMTDPANFPDIRKFEFGKPVVYAKKVMYDPRNPRVSNNHEVDFRLSFDIVGPDGKTAYKLTGTTGSEKASYHNIESGFMEILYFDSRGNGLLEANFNFIVKGAKEPYGKKVEDLKITDGKIRIRLDK
ncbi:MAG: hypothetical protein QM763_15710 [Agriterribacter sp.]